MRYFIVPLLLQAGEPDPEQPLAQMPGSAALRRGIPRHAAHGIKLFENGKQPFAVREKQLPLHDEEIAGVQVMPFQVFFRRGQIFGKIALENVQHGVEIFAVQNLPVAVLPVHRLDIIIEGNGRDDVVLFRHADDSFFVGETERGGGARV